MKVVRNYYDTDFQSYQSGIEIDYWFREGAVEPPFNRTKVELKFAGLRLFVLRFFFFQSYQSGIEI